MDILVILHQCLNRLRCQLEGNLVLRDHVNMDHIRLDVKKLIIKEGLDEGIGILPQFGVWRLG